MSKNPAVLFYTSDFLTGTALMSDAQVGRYMRLLCLQHQKGHLAEKDMKKICKRYDEDIWAKFIQDDKGLFYNKRMEEEIEKREKFSEKQRENIMKRWNKGGTNDGNTTVLPLENENEIDNDKDNKGSKKGGSRGGSPDAPKKPIKPKEPDIFEGRTFSSAMKEKLKTWFAYKKERRDYYKPIGLKSFLSQVENNLKIYREADILELIEVCMSNNWKGVAWDKLKGKEKPEPKKTETNIYAEGWRKQNEQRKQARKQT